MTVTLEYGFPIKRKAFRRLNKIIKMTLRLSISIIRAKSTYNMPVSFRT